jgi:hypothetical protein
LKFIWISEVVFYFKFSLHLIKAKIQEDTEEEYITKNASNRKNSKAEEDLCKICMENLIECVFAECGHMICCISCSKNLKQCPFCRNDIVKAIKFYK